MRATPAFRAQASRLCAPDKINSPFLRSLTSRAPVSTSRASSGLRRHPWRASAPSSCPWSPAALLATASFSSASSISLDSIPTLNQWQVSAAKPEEHGPFAQSALAARVSLHQGDITRLQVDAVVNAANENLLPGGGVCGAIHRAAGPELKAECAPIGHCATGNAVITKGFALPAKHVIHTVGPRGERPPFLESAYVSCLRLCKDHNIETIAFPCVSTGIFGYPADHAAEVAVETVLAWLAEHDLPKRVVFCVYTDEDLDIYQRMLPTKVTLWPEIAARRSRLHLDDHQDQEAFPAVGSAPIDSDLPGGKVNKEVA